MQLLIGILLLVTLSSVTLFFVSEALINWRRVPPTMGHRNREEEELEIQRQFGEDFSELLEQFRRMIRVLREIRDSLNRPQLFPFQAEVKVMPKTVNVGDTATATLNVLDQFG